MYKCSVRATRAVTAWTRAPRYRIGVWLLLACAPAGPKLVSAEEIGVTEQSALIQGRDGGGSALAFGRSVWTFGDTVLNVDDEDGQNWHHNSVSWTDDFLASDGIGGFEEPLDAAGAPRHLIPPSDEEQAFNLAHAGDPCAEEPCGARWAVWPGTPMWDAANGRAYVFYGLIYAEPGDMNFTGVGQSIAIWSDPDLPPERPVIDASAEHPDVMWGPDGGSWGVASAIVEDHLYAFACDQEGLGRPCRLGRAPLSSVQDRAAWRYWDGDGWDPSMDAAKSLFEGAPIMSLSWDGALDAWLLVYSAPMWGRIEARTAPELTGPWSAAVTVYEPSGDAPYDANHHPELEESDGAVQYITWSRHTEGWFGTEFPILRVELE